MKILLCHNFYQQPGGECVALHAHKRLLEEQGHTVLWYSRDNAEINDYTMWRKASFFPNTLYSQRTNKEIQQLVESEQPDLAHVHNVFPLLTPALYDALAETQVPIIQTVHNYRMMCINGLFLRDGHICESCRFGNFIPSIRHRCYRDSYLLSGLYALTIGGHRYRGVFDKITHFIALSDFAAQKLIESRVTTASKVSVLGNFLSTPLPTAGPPDLDDPYAVYLGRLSAEKGILTLLHAMRGCQDLGLKILGSGPLSNDIQAFIQEHHLTNVEMLGFVDGKQKYDILLKALACIIPSECYENFPFTVLESAAVGTPVIASQIGSLISIVADGETGLLFNPGDPVDLQAKLYSLWADPQTAIRLGQQARQWLEQQHTDKVHYRSLLDIYRQVLV